MNTIKEKSNKSSYYNACLAMIWIMSIYSSIIQYKFIKIPNGMIIFGVAILMFYYLANSGKPYILKEELAEESIYMLIFIVYMFSIGTLISISSNHISQTLTCFQYLFILIVISSLIKGTGTNSIHLLLLIQAILLAAVFILDPISHGAGRYSISIEVNPNGLGMAFAAGAWAALYRQQENKLPIVFMVIIIAIFGYCIIQTGSRKSLIATGLVSILWLVFCFLPGVKKKNGYYGIIALIVMGVLIVVIGQELKTLYSDSAIANRMENLQQETAEGKRSNMYRAGIEFIKASPLFGIGFQGFMKLYGTYSHATLVEVPVSGGIIGTILYFSIYLYSVKKSIYLYKNTKGIPALNKEHMRIKMVLILWAVMLFYTTCIIHPYQFDSYVMFGIIFGESAYVEKRLIEMHVTPTNRKKENKYCKYA